LDSVDLDLLKHLTDRESYYKSKDVVHKGMCTKESWALVGDFGKFFDHYPEKEQIDEDFDIWFRVSAHPGWKDSQHQVYNRIISNIRTRPFPESDIFNDQLAHLRFESELSRGLEALRKGSASPADVLSGLDVLVGDGQAMGQDEAEESYTLDDLALHQRSDEGFYWRCEDLNRAIGPVRTGDFTIVAKRPEVGGTSFLTSEMTFMLEQMPPGSKAVMFNNEEAPDKVFTRLVSGAIGVDYRTMMSAPKIHQKEYEDWLDGRAFDLKHNTSMDLTYVRKQCEANQYSLIGINVLLKVGGTGKLEDHDKLQWLGEEMRKLAQDYGPVIAVVQADPSAEGMRYIPQDRIYKSKTALQGEADVLIMIGHDPDGAPDSRYIHVAKNKIPPAPCCDLTVKHIKSEVAFDMGTGRFTSKNHSTNSRPKK
jgi:replicative DNA helicase